MLANPFNKQMRIVYGDAAEGSGRGPFFSNVFTLKFNPSTYKQGYTNVYSDFQELHTLASPNRFALSKAEEMEFTFLFDDTGVSDFGVVQLAKEFTRKFTVKKQIERFLEATTTINGEIHEPNTLRLIWGTLDFRCKLTAVDIHYKLFNRLGHPLRAELACKFRRHYVEGEEPRLRNNSSPDVTHQRILKAGDSLPFLCHQIYGNASLYTDVAAANKINNFRDIAPGTKIIFPPLA